MKKNSSFLVIFLLALVAIHKPLKAQSEFYACFNDGSLVRTDANNCNPQLVCAMELGGGPFRPSDIAITPNGQVYACNQSGDIYRINTANGQATLVITVNSSANVMGLVAINNNLLIEGGTGNSPLRLININTPTATPIGNTGYNVLGDLAFYQGKLYAAVMDNVSGLQSLLEINLNTTYTAILNKQIVRSYTNAQLGNGSLFGLCTIKASPCSAERLIISADNNIYDTDLNTLLTPLCSNLYSTGNIYGLASSNEAPYTYPTRQVNVNICTGDTYLAGGQIRNTSGTYTDTINIANSECDSLLLTNLTVENTYLTRSATITVCEGQNVVIFGQTRTQPGAYIDTLEITGCDSIITINLAITPIPVAATLSNIFTPNADGKNDLFPDIQNAIENLTIYNRWGNKVWDSHVAWQGKDASDGVYFYKIITLSCGNKKEEKTGTVTLLRN